MVLIKKVIMDIEHIRQLIDLMEEKDLLTLEVCSGDDKVSLTRYYQPIASTISAVPTALPTSSQLQEPNSAKQSGHVENSPMVGVFYSAPSPNEPPFVKVGQTVQAGDTLGIIEAMKIMNPLEATQSGVIAEILVENGDVVQFGQPVVRYQS